MRHFFGFYECFCQLSIYYYNLFFPDSLHRPFIFFHSTPLYDPEGRFLGHNFNIFFSAAGRVEGGDL